MNPLDRPCPLAPGAIVVAYARDSGGGNQDDRSVQQQIDLYQQYCQRHHLHLRHIYVDRAASAATATSREQFQQMIADLRAADDLSGLILWKLNRLARNIDDAQYYKADLRRRGYTIITLADDIPDGPIGTIFESILEWKAQRDRLDISTDASRGLAALVSSKNPDGTYCNYLPGRPPAGFRAVRVRLGTKRNGQPHIVQKIEPDPVLFPLIQRAWQLRATGATYGEIRQQTGIKVALTNIFDNEIYAGVLNYGSLRLEDWLPPDARACTSDQWETVQSLRRQHIRSGGKNSSRHHPRRLSSNYLLTSLIHCGYCGGRMSGNRHKLKSGYYRSYRCTSKKLAAASCPDSTRINAAVIEPLIIDHLASHILTPHVIRELFNRWHHEQTSSNGLRQQRLDHITEQIASVQAKIKNLIRIAESTGDITITERLDQRRIELMELQNHHHLLQQTAAIPATLTDQQINHLVERLRHQLQNGDTKTVLAAFITRIDAKKSAGTVYYTFPAPPKVAYNPVPPRGENIYPGEDTHILQPSELTVNIKWRRGQHTI